MNGYSPFTLWPLVTVLIWNGRHCLGQFGSQHHPQHRTVDCHDERVVLVDNMSEFDFLHSVCNLSSAFPFFLILNLNL